MTDPFLHLMGQGITAAESGRYAASSLINDVVRALFPEGLTNIFNWALSIGGVMAFGIIIYNGIVISTSLGDLKKISGAKQNIWGAVIGIAIIAGGYLILYTINPSLLGFRIDFPSIQKIGSQTSSLNQKLVGQFSWPTQNGFISSAFGPRNNKIHHGIDIAVSTGTSIFASKAGTVTISSYSATYGNMVKIQHTDGYTTLYAHCSRLLVYEGQKVNEGEAIALAGSTGNSTGPHVHFEIALNGTRINPLCNNSSC